MSWIHPNCLSSVPPPPSLPQPPDDRPGICSEFIFMSLFCLCAHRPEARPGPCLSAGCQPSSFPLEACPCPVTVTEEHPQGTKQCQLLHASRTRCQMSLPGCDTCQKHWCLQHCLLLSEEKAGAELETRRPLRAFRTRTVTAGATIWDKTRGNSASALLLD